jgi:hypothetical protein
MADAAAAPGDDADTGLIAGSTGLDGVGGGRVAAIDDEGDGADGAGDADPAEVQPAISTTTAASGQIASRRRVTALADRTGRRRHVATR